MSCLPGRSVKWLSISARSRISCGSTGCGYPSCCEVISFELADRIDAKEVAEGDVDDFVELDGEIGEVFLSAFYEDFVWFGFGTVAIGVEEIVKVLLGGCIGGGPIVGRVETRGRRDVSVW